MDDSRIVQKDEIDVVLSMRGRIAHKREVRVALLPDCSRASGARE